MLYFEPPKTHIGMFIFISSAIVYRIIPWEWAFLKLLDFAYGFDPKLNR